MPTIYLASTESWAFVYTILGPQNNHVINGFGVVCFLQQRILRFRRDTKMPTIGEPKIQAPMSDL
jgi:hypothetical protein